METAQISVVIPAYGQGRFLAQAIDSALGQPDVALEVVVVDDASPDDTQGVVARYDDPRLRCVVHETNRGLPAARNTGIAQSRGDLIAFLDADDYFHPGKLQAHVAFMKAHADIGITYNARYELHHDSVQVRTLWEPPAQVGLQDYLLGFPFAPSDMVVRRRVLETVGGFDESLINGAEDLDLPLRMALAGQRFGRVPGVFNYRRYHAGRRKKHLDRRLAEYRLALDRAFAHAQLPPALAGQRDRAHAGHSLEVAWFALLQGDLDLGQSLLEAAVAALPALLTGAPPALIRRWTRRCAVDRTADPEERIPALLAALPASAAGLRAFAGELVADALFMRGCDGVLWDAPAGWGLPALKRAAALGFNVQRPAQEQLCHDLLVIHRLLGAAAAEQRLARLTAALRAAGFGRAARDVAACVARNLASASYGNAAYWQAAAQIRSAMIHRPRLLADRGAWSILVRSLWQTARSRTFGS